MGRTGDSLLSPAGGTRLRTAATRQAPKPTEPADRAAHQADASAYLLCVLACLLITGILAMSPDLVFANDSADILPPVISIVSPDPGADLYSPLSITIEVEYTDLGSGVDPATAYLFVNEVDATSEMVASEERAVLTLTGLRQGTYAVRFGVSDNAGNRSEITWSFEVHGVFEEFGFSGTSDLRLDWKPVKKATETLDLALTGTLMGFAVEARSKLRVTDYPGGKPLLSTGELNLYLDKWSVVLSRASGSLSFGHVQAPVALELAAVGPQMMGATGRAKLSLAGGGVDIQAFTGRIARSTGFGISVMDAVGALVEYGAGRQTAIRAAYVSLGGSSGYDVASISGQGILKSVVAVAEVTYAQAHSPGTSGFGLATHLDTVFGRTHVGMDVQLIEESFPSAIAPSWLTAGSGGAVGASIRTTTSLGSGSSLRVDGALVRDNLAGSKPSTSQQINALISYRHRMASGWTLGADHGYQHKTTIGGSGSGAGSTSRSYGVSADGRLSIAGASLPAKGSITATDSIDASTLKQTGSQALSLSMTVRIGGQRLTPALTLKRTLDASGTASWSAELKLGSIDFSLPFDIKAAVSFSAKGTARVPAGAYTPDKTTAQAGAQISLSRQVFRNSTVRLDVGISRWSNTDATSTSGWDQSIGLSLSTRF